MSSLQNIGTSLRAFDGKIKRLQGEYESTKKARASQRIRIRVLEDQVVDMASAIAITQRVAAATQQQLEIELSGIVTSAIQAIFGKPYTFRCQFELKRGRTEAEFCLMDEAGNEFHPEHDNGGGVVDVVSFALRLSCWRLANPRTAKVMIFDEPLKFVSAEYREPVADFLSELSRKLKMQVIMVTHEPAFIDRADNVIRIGTSDEN